MKARLNPTEIMLKDLPPEGREFTYTRTGGELDSSLVDLIDGNAYEVIVKITPMGNTFDLRGTLKTHLNLDCALCAMDLRFPVEQKLHELLVVEKPLDKGDQLAKNNHAHEWEAGGPDYIMLESEVFNVGEYIHEVIGLAQPIRPLGKPDCDINCENVTDSMRKHLAGEGAPTQAIRANPFSVLEKFKLKS